VLQIIEEDYSNVEPLILWEPSSPDQHGESTASNISVEPFLCKWLRPHQREGVRFMAECLTGQRDFEGTGSILADDMGLGKTLQSITLMYTLLKQGFTSNEPIASKCIIVCPTSLVANWANEIKKWFVDRVTLLYENSIFDDIFFGRCGDRIKCVALSESSKEKVICGIADFMNGKHYPILVIRYSFIVFTLFLILDS
jgi:DNA repair and recombination RAD54-like protein